MTLKDLNFNYGLTFNDLSTQVDYFLNQKHLYLNQSEEHNLNNIIYNKEALDWQSKLNRQLLKFKDIIFNNAKIEFIESIV